MRVAARDVKSGRVRSAVQWIEIPDLSSRRLALSSLILSEQTNNAKTKQENNAVNTGAINLPVTIDRRFTRSSQLRYIIFIYNAAQGKAGTNQSDVTLQTQILRGTDILVTSPARPVSTEGQDPMRLPYAVEISLSALPAGRYELQILVQDRVAKSNTAQRVSFEVKISQDKKIKAQPSAGKMFIDTGKGEKVKRCFTVLKRVPIRFRRR